LRLFGDGRWSEPLLRLVCNVGRKRTNMVGNAKKKSLAFEFCSLAPRAKMADFIMTLDEPDNIEPKKQNKKKKKKKNEEDSDDSGSEDSLEGESFAFSFADANNDLTSSVARPWDFENVKKKLKARPASVR